MARKHDASLEAGVYVAMRDGDIYVGSTTDLDRRLSEHRRTGKTLVYAIVLLSGQYEEIFSKRKLYFSLERKMSRFYALQSEEEDFSMLNTDYVFNKKNDKEGSYDRKRDVGHVHRMAEVKG